eukprot:gene39983-52781_t
MSEQPAASVNCGYSASGLPIGLQIAGQRFDDLGVLRVSRAFEQIREAQRPWPEPPHEPGLIVTPTTVSPLVTSGATTAWRTGSLPAPTDTAATATPAAAAPSANNKPSEQQLAPNRMQNILRAAERLFAPRGFHGVSIRDIADDPGVPLALVGYYYGPKVSLDHAIYRERAGYIEERLRALASAQKHAPPGLLLKAIVSAFVLPVLKVAASDEGRNFLRLLSRGMADHLEEDEPIIRKLFDPLAHAAVPTARRGQIAWCMAPAALAQGEPSGSVTLYAVIDLSVYHKQLAGEKRDRQVASGGMTTSQWGLRGTEDLGGRAAGPVRHQRLPARRHRRER